MRQVIILSLLLFSTLFGVDSSNQIAVGSLNPVKLSAVEEAITDYPILSGLKVQGVSVESGVREQPLSLEETIRGAKQRAKQAFKNCRYSIGIESGFMVIPETNGEYMDVSICSVYDGKQHHIGMSCGFRIPREITQSIINKGWDLDKGLKHHGLTSDPRLGVSKGAIGLFTNGRICRKDYSKQAVIMALISVENPSFFDPSEKQVENMVKKRS